MCCTVLISLISLQGCLTDSLYPRDSRTFVCFSKQLRVFLLILYTSLAVSSDEQLFLLWCLKSEKENDTVFSLYY